MQPDGTFVFATGMECSAPVITGRDGHDVRIDELERANHYLRWREDLALVRELGLRHLRYGVPYHLASPAADRYEWGFTDVVFGEMARLGIVPIADLCHFGVPDWVGDFQNPDWPEHFARYAGAFARRFPWVQHYTPVNEIFVCAKLSALHGQWNERKSDDRSFVRALEHLCRANLLAIRAILDVRPDAVFVQSESAEYFHAGGSDKSCVERARFENERRFLSFDLLYSCPPRAELVLYLLDNGMQRHELDWFMHHGLGDYMIMGNDFYERNEQIVDPGGTIKPAGEVFGWSTITQQYFDRYRRPVMHTETNYGDADEAPRWLWKEYFNVRHARERGIPVVGFTWYSLLDQVDWESGLAVDRATVNPLGLYDLDRRIRPVGRAYREMIEQFGGEPMVPYGRAFSWHAGRSVPPPRQVRSRRTVAARPPARAEVAIVRTTDRRCDAAEVERLVREALAAIGGLERFVPPGATVLLKPNQAVWRVAKDGATTDPRLVAALARLAREAGAARVQVGECSACGQVTREVMAITGMAQAARTAGAELVYFDEVEQIDVAVPRGRILERIAVPRPLLEADVVIACPKLKTHFLDPITGAIKLWVGAVRQDTMHRLHRDRVEDTVADLLTVTRPDLCVMDAIVAGEGNGPVATRGRFVGSVLASSDPVAIDVVAAEVAGFAGARLRFASAAAARGIGVCDRACIDVVGATIEAARAALVPAVVGEGWHASYPCRVIVGEAVTMEGTLGHFKGFADLWQLDHAWDAVVALRGRPTFLIGRAEDPDFEIHLKQGRYFVLDDVALEKYARDPRVVFIPGSPIGNEMIPVIMSELHVEGAGRAAERMLKSWHALQARWHYRAAG
jgi:uncharacterized protein (DUF362 family)/beta-glucosidase/6-phospho-beta-glucosidase/beta-galactosidase